MATSSEFQHLFKPIRIGPMELKNRFILAAMGTGYETAQGFVTERTKEYYAAIANGGTALVVTGVACVHPQGRVQTQQLDVSDDKFIPGLSELAKVIQAHGAKAALQLHHAGRVARPEITRMQPVGPSSTPGWHVTLMREEEVTAPKELTVAEIEEIVQSFARAAHRTKHAGFDCLEIHGAHGYLFAQFLSRSMNFRSDSYGGSLTNRARILIEVVKAIREAVGPDFPFWFRINGTELAWEGTSVHPAGFTVDEAKETAVLLEAAGVDAVHVSGHGPANPITMGAMPWVHGPFIKYAAEVKKAVSIPVIAAGRIDPRLAEKTIKELKADLVAVGRALLADPDLPSKVAANRSEDIVPCILCMRCIDDHIADPDRGLRCQVNLALGAVSEHMFEPAKTPRSVLVVGGGPAGMETARVAASRGHHVTLCEKTRRLGGQLLKAALPPGQYEFKQFTEYLETQVHKLGVNVQLGTEVTADLVQRINPDILVVATGAAPTTIDVPGVAGRNVVDLMDVLGASAQVGNKVVIVTNGGFIGYQSADLLATRGHQVTIVDMVADAARDVGMSRRPVILGKLKNYGVRIATGMNIVEITERGVLATSDGVSEMFVGDSVALAVGRRPKRELASTLVGVRQFYLVGDCVQPRQIREALVDANHVARGI